MGESASVWIGSGSLWRPQEKQAHSAAQQLHRVATHGRLSIFMDTQTHPMQLAVTVDTVILATQQEKESLLFQL